MKIAILGFGVEGQSAYRYWSKQNADITIHDNNPRVEIPAGVKSVLSVDAYKYLDNYKYDFIVRSPGSRMVEQKLKTLITSPTAEFFDKCPASIIGVTGTKGKGTTATLIHEMLEAAGKNSHLVGNIGNPALDELGDIQPEDYVVFELSSFQLIDMHQSPHIAVCLMIVDDHLDWHQSRAEYHAAKGRIFKFQNESDVAVYKADDEISSELAKLSPATTQIGYWEGGKVVFQDGRIEAFGAPVIEQTEIAMPGLHNLQNICAAVAAVWSVTPDTNAIKNVLMSFTGLPYHIELVHEKNGVRYYNDSFSTNPTSTIAAVESFSEPLILYLGGFDKEADFSDLAQVLKVHKIRKIVTYGKTGQRIAGAFDLAGVANVEFITGADFEAIIKTGLQSAQSGDVVLFSPANASWDMFDNYKARGELFNQIVRNY